MGPSNEISAIDLVKKLLQEPCPSEIVEFPRKGKSGEVAMIRIKVLEQSEHDNARFAAEEYLSKKGIKPDYRDKPAVKEIYGDAVAREILFRACVGVDPISRLSEIPNYPRLFMNAEQLGTLTADELADLFTKYMIVQYKYGPNQYIIRTDEDVTAWVLKIKDGLDSLPLSSMDWHQLAGLNLLLSKRSYVVSQVLESLFSRLPDTLKLDLEKLGIGIGSFGLLPSTKNDELDFSSLIIDEDLVKDIRERINGLGALVAELDDNID